MKRITLMLSLQCLFIQLLAQEFEVDTLLFSGPADNRINYVIMGDGYRTSELPTFGRDAESITKDLFEASPFSEYQNYFNVFIISVPSNVSGAARDPGNLIDNYFGSTFNFAGIERLLVPTRSDRVSAVLAANFPTYDQVFVLVNDSKYGGSGGWIATSSTNAAASEVSIHEIGHSFGNLSDEYWAGAQYAFESPNMTQVASRNSVKWKNWLDDFEIGIYSHADDPSWYKPHQGCKMQFLGVPFCAVCKEQLIRNIQDLVSVVEEYSPENADEVSGTMNFSLSLIEPDPNSLEVIWWLNGEQFDQGVNDIQLTTTALEGDLHVLEAVIVDATALDRRDRVKVTTVRWNIDTSVTSNVLFSEQNRNKSGVVTSIVNTSAYTFKTFPNPVKGVFTVEYIADQPGPIQLTLFDLNGQQLELITNQFSEAGNFSYNVDLTGYKQGLYIVEYKSGSFERRTKVIKSE